MTIEEGEEIFDKDWHQWSDLEKKEFVAAIEPEQLQVAVVLAMAMTYPDALSEACRNWIKGRKSA